MNTESIFVKNQKRSAYENFTASILEDGYPTRLEPQQLPEPRTAAPGAMVFRWKGKITDRSWDSYNIHSSRPGGPSPAAMLRRSAGNGRFPGREGTGWRR